MVLLNMLHEEIRCEECPIVVPELQERKPSDSRRENVALSALGGP